MEQKFRGFTFTDFELNEDRLKDIFDGNNLRFLAYGKETCPSTKREHLQGFLYFNTPRTLKSVIKIMKPRHVEIIRGNFTQNEKYCSKEGQYKTFGEPPKQGERKDIEELAKDIANGVRVDDIAESNPMLYHMYGRTLNKLEDLALRKRYRTEMTTGTWYYGPTGAGKSHVAFKDFSPTTHYVWNANDNGWWDGYAQQDTVIINDFRGGLAYNDLLTLVDKWPHSVTRRGREPMPFTSKHVIITSSLHPRDVYKNLALRDSLEQLYRRFNIIYMDGSGSAPSADESGHS